MKYRKTFREALNDVEKKGKPEAKPEVADEKPTEDKDAIIKKLELEIANLKAQAELLIAPQPNSDTGEVPLRTGVAQAILDKKNGTAIAKKVKKEKISIGKGQTKIDVDPEVNLGIGSGGGNTGSGNLH